MREWHPGTAKILNELGVGRTDCGLTGTAWRSAPAHVHIGSEVAATRTLARAFQYVKR